MEILMFDGYEGASINSDGGMDSPRRTPITAFSFPEDYFVRGIEQQSVTDGVINGKEYYGGIHQHEYLVCSWKNGKKVGEGLLYDQFGELKFRGSFVDDCLEGAGYIYNDGAVAYKIYFHQNKKDLSSYIVFTESAVYMEEYSQDGYLIYRGGFNDDRQREGYGAEYLTGQLSSYGLYENNVSIQRFKLFSGSTMREFDMEVENNIIYVGGFKNSIEDGFPRDGEGREFNDNGLIFHGYFKDNVRHGKGTVFYTYGVASLKGIWDHGVLKEQHELDKRGFFKNVKFNGHSQNSIHVINDRMILSPNIEEFFIGDKMCNGEEIKCLNLLDMDRVQKISIGNHCFSNVTIFEVSNLNFLKSIDIGRDSFTLCDRIDNRPCDPGKKELCKGADSQCMISYCPHLIRITIAEGSFSSYCNFSIHSFCFNEFII